MFISENNRGREKALKSALIWLWAALFLVFFGAVYEHFSHGVYSYFMLYAFAFPLAGEVLPNLILARSAKGRIGSPASRSLWGAGITALTAGSVFRGILEIYGTTNRLTAVYWIAGGLLAAAGLIAGIAAGRSPEGAEEAPSDPSGRGGR